MTLEKAIETLDYYQRWRLGADIPQPNPKQITEAVNFALNILKNLDK